MSSPSGLRLPHRLVGWSGTIRDTVIVFGSGASAGVKRKLAAPTLKPTGNRVCTASRWDTYSDAEWNTPVGA